VFIPLNAMPIYLGPALWNAFAVSLKLSLPSVIFFSISLLNIPSGVIIFEADYF